MTSSSITGTVARDFYFGMPALTGGGAGGESYRDVVLRLEPVIMELERQEKCPCRGTPGIELSSTWLPSRPLPSASIAPVDLMCLLDTASSSHRT